MRLMLASLHHDTACSDFVPALALGDKRVAHHVPPEVDEVIEGVVDHLLHVSYDERTVLRLTSTGDGEESITVVGKALFGAKPGESLRLRGSWSHHPRYGRQFKAGRCERTVPADERAIRLYLASGMIRGIGPALAAAIVDTFRDQTLKVIDAEPERLLEVHNIGEIRLGRITAAWQEQKAIAEIMMFLQQLGITPGLAVKIYTTYADTDDDPIDIVRRSPYRLCRDVHGVGFVNADKIALAVGVPKHSEERLQAALLHELDQAGGQGHCHLPVRVLLARTRKLLTDDDPATADPRTFARAGKGPPGRVAREDRAGPGRECGGELQRHGTGKDAEALGRGGRQRLRDAGVQERGRAGRHESAHVPGNLRNGDRSPARNGAPPRTEAGTPGAAPDHTSGVCGTPAAKR
ncbi:hypothetical protein FEF34_13380 [Streptomyces marianii]|uniref:Uncharacterized protein n=1 Tax=Streptomyces marianii TaxID=1817406 RepID=A0A5R9E234_9ACTN|nr:hypothetical protein FEF34_13380 [Streptomyces marianii]